MDIKYDYSRRRITTGIQHYIRRFYARYDRLPLTPPLFVQCCGKVLFGEPSLSEGRGERDWEGSIDYYCGNCGFLFACSLDVGSFVCGGACEAMDGWWRGGGWTGTGKDMVGLVDERYWARR